MWTYQDKLLKQFSIKLIYFCDCAFSLIHLIIFIPYTCANEISGPLLLVPPSKRGNKEDSLYCLCSILLEKELST